MYLTRKEVAAKFGVGPRTIDNWRKNYSMPYYRMGGQVRFVESEVDAWAKTMRRGKPVPGMVLGETGKAAGRRREAAH